MRLIALIILCLAAGAGGDSEVVWLMNLIDSSDTTRPGWVLTQKSFDLHLPDSIEVVDSLPPMHIPPTPDRPYLIIDIYKQSLRSRATESARKTDSTLRKRR